MQKKGFTLIELLVVITIIGILITVGSVSYTRALKLSRDSKRKTDLEQVRQALETYRSDIHTYPIATGAIPSLLSTDYITIIPTDPKSTGAYGYKSSTGTDYFLCASLETGSSSASPSCAGLSCGTGVCNYFVTRP